MAQPYKSASEIARLVRSKELTAVQAVENAFNRITAVENKVDAFLFLRREEALKEARSIDERVSRGENVGLLAGVPVAIKDNMCIEGVPTTCASKILEGYRPPYTATVVEKLVKAGAVVIGKTNLDEFAMGSSCENSAYKPTKNPHDLKRIPGGSSGGSAAAVSSAMAPIALGSDTGGSIRQPAALTGTVGLKPTYGRVSRYGLVAFSSSLDQIGPFSRTIKDAALVMNVISGRDEKDSTSSIRPVPDYVAALNGDIKGLRVGLPKEYFIPGMQADVEKSVHKAADILKSLGAKVSEVTLPHSKYAVAVYYIVATAEASSNLARYDGAHYGYRAKGAKDLIDLYQKSRKEGFGNEVKRRIMLGTFALSSGYHDAYYKKALQVRALLKRDFDEAFKDVDVIIAPTSPTTAFKLGEKTSDPLSMYLSDVFTISANLATIPAISIPCGKDSAGLPIGMQVMGPAWSEDLIFRVCARFEEAAGLAPLVAEPK
jgi:aspartyl-tRNA(Asn)/glutamyl-tRNA(Gln) amidotransferase subunit A